MMGHLKGFSASGGGNLNKNFPKNQIMPGEGCLSFDLTDTLKKKMCLAEGCFLSFHAFTLLMGDVFEGTIPVPGNIASLWFILIAPEQITSNKLIMPSVCQHKLLNMKVFEKMRKTVFHSYINNDTGLCIEKFSNQDFFTFFAYFRQDFFQTF